MTRKPRTLRWHFLIRILPLVLVAGCASSSHSVTFMALPFFPTPTSTFSLFNLEDQGTATATPFQPLPTETPTPTSTPTSTATPKPTRTPVPATQTPQPIPTSADGLPVQTSISGVVGHAQYHTLSCESRSAVDWAVFYGMSIDEDDFQYSLPSSDNPEEGFVGSINGAQGKIPPASYGVHAPPVAARLRAYGLTAKSKKGYSFQALRSQIANGNPVIVWVIGNTWPGTPVTYTSSDGDKVTVAHYEHTAIIIGYDEYGVTLVDNNWVYWRSTADFLNSWAVLGNLAIIH